MLKTVFLTGSFFLLCSNISQSLVDISTFISEFVYLPSTQRVRTSGIMKKYLRFFYKSNEPSKGGPYNCHYYLFAKPKLT